MPRSWKPSGFRIENNLIKLCKSMAAAKPTARNEEVHPEIFQNPCRRAVNLEGSGRLIQPCKCSADSIGGRKRKITQHNTFSNVADPFWMCSMKYHSPFNHTSLF